MFLRPLLNMMASRSLLLLLVLSSFGALAQQPTVQAPDALPSEVPDKPWYQRIGIRGYGQFRYNRLLETNPDLQCEQCDRSWGDNGGFFIRRARIIFFGQVHRNVFIYL